MKALEILKLLLVSVKDTKDVKHKRAKADIAPHGERPVLVVSTQTQNVYL